MRPTFLSAVKAGITRLRDKGGASPDALYDLVNGYVTAARTIQCRPGTRIEVAAPEGTKGLVWFGGKYVVFSHQVVASTDALVEVEVICHPTDPALALADIHFAMPFLGYLYVVAEFENGDVRHYWLEKGELWEPNKVYLPGTLVRPATPNGLMYRVESDRAGYTPWAPDVARAEGDVVVPTVDNGFRYVVVEVTGSQARSGRTEPDWPAVVDATVYEDANLPNPYQPGSGSDSYTQVPGDVGDRYGRPGDRTTDAREEQ